jgi:ABC-type bacteriocin/lantibiotic exporter with double-glycine peptidase domain
MLGLRKSVERLSDSARWLAVALACILAIDSVYVFALLRPSVEEAPGALDEQIVQQVKPVPIRGANCGAKSLYVLCKLHGITTNMLELRRLTNTGEQGATMRDLKNAAVALGFQGDGYEVSFEELRRHLTIPGNCAILHSSPEHFFPAVGAVDGRLRLLDPGIGVEDAGEATLKGPRYRWDGKSLLLTAPRTRTED